MKILVVSDTHGQNHNLEAVLKKSGPLDMLIHLGDVGGSADYIRAISPCPLYMVAGNNDFFSDLQNELEISIGSYQVLLTHGHYYGVYRGPEHLFEEAVRRGFDIVMYGHVHRPVLEQRGHITVLNPGSLSYPRQDNRKPSYLLMDLDSEGKAHYTVNYLEPDRAEKFYDFF